MQNLDGQQLSRVRGKLIGFIFQAFNLIPQLTVTENVQAPLFDQGVPARERARLAQQAIDRVGLSDRAAHRPPDFSGGQMRCARVSNLFF